MTGGADDPSRGDPSGSDSPKGDATPAGDALDLQSALGGAVRKHRDETAVVSEERSLTYGDLDREANALANALVEAGVGREDRVALLMENRVEYPVAYLAVVKAGAAEVPLNEMLTEAELRYRFEDADVEAVVCGPAFVETVASIADDVDSVDHCLGIAGEDELPASFRSYGAVVDGYDGDAPPQVDVEPDHEASHSFTGGTTGRPKGVVHTQSDRTTNLYAHVFELDLTSTDTLLLMTPLAHSAGRFLTASWLAGSTAVIREGFDPEAALETIESRGVTWTFLVPTMVYTLLDSGLVASYDTDTLENVVYGAAPMTPARLEEAIDAFGPVFTQFYGQTEVPNLITTLSKADHERALGRNDEGVRERLSSAGRPSLMADVRVVDAETGAEQPSGEIGEIVATAPYTMKEYYGRPEETAETLRDGWVRTGDVGRQDEDGFVYLLDRKSDMIITGGMNVYSIEVEEALDEHPGVREVAVVGVPDDKWGEAVKAVVVKRQDADPTENDLVAFADERLADFKVPKSVDFVEEIPTTPYGKADKKALRDRYWDDAERDVA